MNSALVAARRYSSLSEHTRSPKDLEYDVILDVTRELKSHSGAGTTKFSELARALNKNERLWIEIGTQVADPDNALSPDLRARLFYLAQFVGHQTSKVFGGSARVESLVETNVAVLRGLKGKA
ncbi:flagellar biosynthesis regulator FlaF [Planktotalea arctica]|uniref:flagellar biosynthesis regulator FlaF n=1 Tax=Planktotalea arctica TaxID=1481893 RepID=UPI000A16E1A5|nr:flagellar biosynthesis regulator FlaF [Planktotalea arctica]